MSDGNQPFLERNTGEPAYGSARFAKTEKKKLIINFQSEDLRLLNIELDDEDHTMGNSIRHSLAKNKNVEFIGYVIPHPSVQKVKLRLQVYEDSPRTAMEVFDDGLQDLKQIGNHILDTFRTSIKQFKESGLVTTEDCTELSLHF